MESTTIVVGAGPAGLATAACLTQNSIPYLLLEREDCFAPLWKKKTYKRLHLHLPKHTCELPLMKFPSTYPNYVPRSDFLQYLDSYVDHFHINPLYLRRVVGASFDQDSKRWHIRAKNMVEGGGEEEYLGRYLVVANGESSDPLCPHIEGLSGFQGKVIHSTQYKSGKECQGKNVLVVGAGNSGWEISLDLAEHGVRTSIVVRSPVHVLAREMVSLGVFLVQYLPLNVVDTLIVMLSKFAFSGFSRYGLRRPREGPFYSKITFGKFPIIDVGTYKKIKSGDIKVLPGVRSIKGNDVLFEDGRSFTFDAIIFATGFKRSTHEWLQGDEYLLGEDGLAKQSFPNHWKGKNGLYCVGLAKRGLFGIATDAQNVARDIKSQL